MSSIEPPRAVLDACVLVGIVRRELLFAAGKSGYYRPFWSERIEAEWRSALLRQAGVSEAAAIDGEIALARLAFPDAIVTGWEAHEGPLNLPDWNDRHVLAAAIAAKAPLIVTDNLRDFPRRALFEHGTEALSADAFLFGWSRAQPDAAQAAALAVAGVGSEPTSVRQRLKRARLPRFAKEIERLEGGLD